MVTLGPGETEPRMHFGRDSVNFADLAERLEKLRTDGANAHALVLLQTDAGTPVGVERQVTEMVLQKGFRLAVVGANAPGPQFSEPKPTDE